MFVDDVRRTIREVVLFPPKQLLAHWLGSRDSISSAWLNVPKTHLAMPRVGIVLGVFQDFGLGA
jgi:hypothetical protein